jgi:acetyl esterase/lipase
MRSDVPLGRVRERGTLTGCCPGPGTRGQSRPVVVGAMRRGAVVVGFVELPPLVTLAIDGTSFPVHVFVAVAPAFSGIGHPQPDPSEAARRGVRGVLIVGEHDTYRPEGEEVQRGLTASGVGCELVVEPGIGHVIPPGFESRLEAALDLILRDARAQPSNVAS